MKSLLTILLVSIAIFSSAQSKKEQIDFLVSRVDSLEKKDSLIVLKLEHLLNENFKLGQEIIHLKDRNKVLSDNYTLFTNELKNIRKDVDSIANTNKIDYSKNPKYVLLKNLIGIYELETIGGVQGANTMFDYYKEYVEWHSTFSSIVGGMREWFTNKTGEQDADFLNSLKIEVTEDLKIKLIQGDKTMIEVPFNEKGMDLRISNREFEIHEELAELSEETTFKNKSLMLLAGNSIDLSHFFYRPYLRLITSNNLILSYSLINGAFILQIFSSNVVEGYNTFVFKYQ